MDNKKIHIGKQIHKALKESGMTLSDFAKELHCTRPNVYNIFKNHTIDIERLAKISQILNKDLISLYTISKEERDEFLLNITLKISGNKATIVELRQIGNNKLL